ncbi:MAG: NAD(P)/FAD-dependent oxidoreductase [Saprospiraceae bacterium]|nr:NAD(P)/FAD-dependent oxidoreductase [Saprospiraceae bacterium]
MKNTSKTALFGTLRKALSMALSAHKTNLSAEEIIAQHEKSLISRRKFLENTGKTALVAGLSGLGTEGVLARALAQAAPPRIVIVGAGMAGLNALHTFKKAGVEATVYESSSRTSGRIYSVQEAMGAGTWAEFGAEFIDTNHADMWALAKEFKLELIDYAQESEKKLISEAFFFNGKHYTLAEVVKEFMTIAPQLKKDQESLPDTIDYKTTDLIAKKFDNMSLSEYLYNIGAKGWIKTFIEVAYESEYGLSPAVQSSLNLLLLISPNTEGGHLELFGESDERYKTRGGNQSIPNAIAQKYAANIQLNRALTAIKSVGTTYELTFSGLSTPVVADYVILAIPFTKLRQVSLQFSMPQVKLDCIHKLSYGTNSKLMLGMKSHFWRKSGYGGLVYSDNGIPNGWDNAQLQTSDDQPAGLSILFGGQGGLDVAKGHIGDQVDKYLPKWDQIYPGVKKQFNGKMVRMTWPTYPHNLGSYICYTTGQYTTLSGAEVMPVGNVFFAGEHCGGEFAGFMNGAAKSGREAAEGIMNKVAGK